MDKMCVYSQIIGFRDKDALNHYWALGLRLWSILLILIEFGIGRELENNLFR